MDDDLALRLSALRASFEISTVAEAPLPVPPQNPISEKEPTSSGSTDDDLAARFKKLSSQVPPPRPGKHHSKKMGKELNQETEASRATVDDLIAALTTEISSNPMTSQEEEEEGISTFLEQAELLLPDVPDKEYPWMLNDRSTPKKDNEVTEEDILRRVYDEIEYEKAHGLTQEEEDELTIDEKDGGREFDTSLLSRFQALEVPSLPMTPKFEPSAGRTKWLAPKEQKLVDETDTWCCICNEDAEYQCSGCENDIYCASCLYESHTGPDAGYEERRHKWAKYTKPKKLALA